MRNKYVLKIINLKGEREKKEEIEGGKIKKLEREENSAILPECLKARSYHFVTSCAMAGANNKRFFPKIQL